MFLIYQHQTLKDICAVLRALCLDDDVRVEFGHAHEHARVIASDTLSSITSLLASMFENEFMFINTNYLNISAIRILLIFFWLFR